MGEVFEDEQAVADDLVRLLALHMGDEADAAGIVLVARIVEALLLRQAGRKGGRFRGRGRRAIDVMPDLM